MRNGLRSVARGMYGVSEAMLSYRLRVSSAQTIYVRARQKRG
jgi:hypothetical protein